MRDLVEREMVDGRIEPAPGSEAGSKSGPAPRRARRTVTVNLAESPLGWLRSRGLVDARQFEAGERLRADYERAALAPRVTMQWRARVDGGAAAAIDPTLAQISAKRRFDAALDAVGGGLRDVLWRVVCAGEGLPAAEKALQWPQRAGRVVLTLALDRLADHYALR
ncbi:DUF6456 domain-containing protein [Sphingomonas sp. RB3P16]|uniref:DUF6456 domain-containing protein n=1 Tax=Parasphingomonas frigoris TaxID=3096163 RepID=UPI002FC8BDCD